MKITKYELNIQRPDLVAGRVRLAFLTDLHNAENGEDNEELIHAIREAEPDFILCGGDMIIAKENHLIHVAKDLLLKLAEEYPIYHALGNHELRLKQYPHTYGNMYKDYVEPLKAAGVVFLDDGSELIAVRGKAIQIFGLSLKREYYSRIQNHSLDASEISEKIGAPNPNAINILLAHHPMYMDTYNDWGANLTLCGHYHGGLLRMGEHTGLLTPNLKIFSDKCYGEYIYTARMTGGIPVKCYSKVIVGAGLGEHTIPIRLANPRELVIIDIITGEDA